MSLTLQNIGQIALQAGLGQEGARVAMAIAQTEGGLAGAVGDQAIGGSFGPFQFYTGGMLPAYAKSLGVALQEAAQIATQYPEHAAAWALSGYLGQAIKAGIQQGLSGTQLATYAQTYGQRSESPERAGANYDALFGNARLTGTGVAMGADPGQSLVGGAKMGYQQTGPEPVPGEITLTEEQLAELLRMANPPTGGQPSAGTQVAGTTSSGYDPESELSAYSSGTRTSALDASKTQRQIEQWVGKSIQSVTPEAAYIDVPDPATGGLTKKKADNPDKSSVRVTFVDGTYMTVRESTPGSKTYNVVNSGDAFKKDASSASTAVAWARLEWDKAQAKIKALLDAGDKSLAQAKQMADEEYRKIETALTQRGQDVTQRGQDMSLASQMGQMAQTATSQDIANIVPGGTSEDLNKVAAAWKSGTVADVKFKPVNLPYNPATVGLDVAREILGLPRQGATVGPNGVQAPTVVLPPKAPTVDLSGLAGAQAIPQTSAYAIQAPALVKRPGMY